MSDMELVVLAQQQESEGDGLSKVAALCGEAAMLEVGDKLELDDDRRTPKGVPDAHSLTGPSASSKDDKAIPMRGQETEQQESHGKSQQETGHHNHLAEPENSMEQTYSLRPLNAAGNVIHGAHLSVFPGAFAHGGIGASNHLGSLFDVETQLSEDGGLVDSAASNPNSLAVAYPISEEALQDLPQAADTTILDRKREGRQKKVKTEILLGVIICCALVVIVLAVVISTSKKSSTSGAPSELSSSSSQAPTSFEGHVLSLFPDDTIAAITEDLDSPQSKAFHWLLEDMEQQIGSQQNDRINQRFALATLFFATDGHLWTNNTNWLNHTVHECNWYSKPDFAQKGKASQYLPGYMREIHPSSEPTPTICDKNGLYQHVWLDQNNLEGSLPEEIYMLTFLHTLSLGANQLHGTISSHIGQLTLLDGLVINQLQNNAGTIPTEIGLLRDSLRAIDLTGNNHEGSLPSELWQLSKLEYMLVENNQELRGSIPSEIGTISTLRWLSAGASGFTGKAQ